MIKKILFVHRDAKLRQKVAALIRQDLGRAVIEAESFRDVVSALNQYSVDLIVCDTALSGGSLSDLLFFFEQAHLSIPFIVFSNEEHKIASQYKALGVFSCSEHINLLECIDYWFTREQIG